MLIRFVDSGLQTPKPKNGLDSLPPLNLRELAHMPQISAEMFVKLQRRRRFEDIEDLTAEDARQLEAEVLRARDTIRSAKFSKLRTLRGVEHDR